MPADLQGRVAVVTGASRGIGKEIARALLERRAHVIALSRNTERGQAAVEQLRREQGGEIEFIKGDLGRCAEVRRVAAAIRERTDSIHILVNNAGVFRNDRDLTPDGLELTFAVNQMAPFLLTRELEEPLRAAAPSRVITVSSEAHRQARFDLTDLQGAERYRGMTAYANSKLANILFTRELARRLDGSGVTALSLHPGVVDTDLLRSYKRELPWVLRIFVPLLSRLFTSEARVAAQGVLTLAADRADAELTRHAGAYFTGGHLREPAPDALSSATSALWWAALEQICADASDPVD